MNPLDSYVLGIMHSIQNPLLTDLMLIITNLVSYAVISLVILLLIFKKEKKLTSNMLIGLLIEGLLTLTIKSLIGRPRPLRKLQRIGGYSFTSGHSGRSTLLGLLFSNRFGKRIIWYSLTALVIFSRLYLRVHYVTDVIGGMIVGGVVYFIVKKYDLGIKAREKINSKLNLTVN